MAHQTDYFLLFTNAAAAQADATVGTYWDGSNWRGDVCFTGLKIVTAQAIINSISSLTGFWILISNPGALAALDSHPNLVMKLDRDAAALGGAFVVSAVISGTNRTGLTISPVPHGAQYPRPLGQ